LSVSWSISSHITAKRIILPSVWQQKQKRSQPAPLPRGSDSPAFGCRYRKLAHSWHLHRNDQTVRHSAAAITKSSSVPPASLAPAPAAPIGIYATTIQRKASAEAIPAYVAAATGAPFTNAKGMGIPQQDHWKRAMEEERTSILFNNTVSTLNSQEARPLQVKPIGSEWVHKTKRNHDRAMWKTVWLVIIK
jgi:hypothetical protein